MNCKKMYLLKYFVDFEDGVDYYGFMGQIRIIGSKLNKSAMQVLEYWVDKQKQIESGVCVCVWICGELKDMSGSTYSPVCNCVCTCLCF